MLRTLRSPLASLGSAATLALALAACSDPIAPSVGSGALPVAAIGTNTDAPLQFTFGSGVETSGGSPNRDTRLEVNSGAGGAWIDAYVLTPNVRWHTPIAGTQWIGPRENANLFYSYPQQDDAYRTTFDIPAGATAPTLNMFLWADNAATVFVNGVQIGQQDQVDNYANYGCLDQVPADECSQFATDPYAYTTEGESIPWNVGGTNEVVIVVNNAEYKQGCSGVEEPTPECASASGLNFLAEVRFEVPPPAVCDFMTFGRLVLEHEGQKVIVSGNAGGNKPHGGILGEMNVEIDGVTYHVANIDSYGPITDGGVLSGYENARIFTGIAKNGAAVEVRMWDGGEPGKGTDRVYVKVAGGPTVGEQLIDQGNLQYHATCRGPQ